MIQANFGYNEADEANIIILGFTMGELHQLLREHHSISLDKSKLNLNIKLSFIGIADRDDLTRILNESYPKIEELHVAHICEKFYVIPIQDDDNQLYLIAFDGTTEEELLAGEVLTVRIRGDHISPVKLYMCAGTSDDDLIGRFGAGINKLGAI
jgi:hypothetical protein